MTDAKKIAAAPSASEDRKKELSKLSLYLEECLEFSEQRRTPVRFLCFRYSFNYSPTFLKKMDEIERL